LSHPSFEARRRWLAPQDDGSIPPQTHMLAFPRRDSPGSCIYFPPNRGRGECRMPNAPAVWWAEQGRQPHQRSHHRFTGTPDIPARNGLTAYFVISPEYRAFLPPSPCRRWHVGPVGLSTPPQDLTPTSEASGPHDLTVRCNAVRLARTPVAHGSGSIHNPPCYPRARSILPRPSHPVPTSVTIAKRPSVWDGMSGM
jgi:hypothetical protein